MTSLEKSGIPDSTIQGWRGGRSPSLENVQALAAGTETPVCYWVDDKWPVGEPGEIPAHYRGRGYTGGRTDGGRVGDGRGAGFAAEEAGKAPEGVTGSGDARARTEAELLALAKRLVKSVRDAIDDGVPLDEVERAIVQALRRRA